MHGGPDQPGVFRLGDQAAVIPSFCGDGMAIALHSGRLAAEALLRGAGSAAYHRALRRDAGPPVRFAHALYRLTRSRIIRDVAVAGAGRWPGLLRAVARRTRVAPAERQAGGGGFTESGTDHMLSARYTPGRPLRPKK